MHGAVQVGETLTADASDIADANGLTGVTFSYQWVVFDGNIYTDIQDATDTTYTLAPSDEGTVILVRVSFTDDAGNVESLTSTTTDAVAKPPLTVSLEGPSITTTVYDGSITHTFNMLFSEELSLSHITLRDHAFTVDGGSVVQARRTDKPSN